MGIRVAADPARLVQLSQPLLHRRRFQAVFPISAFSPHSAVEMFFSVFSVGSVVIFLLLLSPHDIRPVHRVVGGGLGRQDIGRIDRLQVVG